MDGMYPAGVNDQNSHFSLPSGELPDNDHDQREWEQSQKGRGPIDREAVMKLVREIEDAAHKESK